MAAVLGIGLRRVAEFEHGAAFGAARLGRLAVTGEDPALVCTRQPTLETIAPDPELAEAYAPALAAYRALYPALRRTSASCFSTAGKVCVTLLPGLIGRSPAIMNFP